MSAGGLAQARSSAARAKRCGRRAARLLFAPGKDLNMTQPLKIGVLLSGSGTNLQALIDDIAAGALNAEIVQVVSSRPDAYGIERAQAADIPVLVMNKTL